jgi:hypothetical protein
VLDRITFLKVLGVSALWPWLDGARLLATVDHLSPAESSIASPQFDLLFASAEAFRPHVDTTFLVRSKSGAQATLRLAAVVELPRMANIEQFSLRFHASSAMKELAGTRSFEHPTLGHFELFITAVGAPTTDRVVYEACLSRVVSHG